MLTLCEGDAFHGIKTDKLFLSVGIKKPGERLRVNFGQTPFVFDIDKYMEASLIRGDTWLESRC